MYKKFLVSMLLTAALAGCGQQSSDKQAGDQTDTAMPVQDQITNSVPPVNGVDQTQQPVNPSSVEPTQIPPSTETPGATQQPPAGGSDTTTPTPPNPADNAATPSTPPPPPVDNKDSTSHSTEVK